MREIMVSRRARHAWRVASLSKNTCHSRSNRESRIRQNSDWIPTFVGMTEADFRWSLPRALTRRENDRKERSRACIRAGLPGVSQSDTGESF